ncbi:MAG: hypothetical protein LQ344_000426 [Seirophora lacunosa]|nr:MAG: hypothetical protein LQ344_000426 [Seirophora lacunosa]
MLWYHDERIPGKDLAWYEANTLGKQRNAKIHRENEVRKAKKGRTKKEIEKLKKQVEALRSETKEKETETVKSEVDAFKKQTAEEKEAVGYAATAAHKEDSGSEADDVD